MGLLTWLMPRLIEALGNFSRFAFASLGHGDQALFDVPYQAGKLYLTVALPAFAAAAAMAIAAGTVPNGLVIVPLSVDPSRINPAAGLKRMWRPELAWDLLRAALKLGLLAWLIQGQLRGRWEGLMALTTTSPLSLLSELGNLMSGVGWRLAALGLAFAAADFAFRRFQYERRIKMSKQEVKEERKAEEGHPMVKGRIKRLQRKAAKGRSLKNVPRASVVVVNPTHFAVALQYHRGAGGAPQVVAKGRDLIAEQIIDLARRHGIPIYRNEPLARSLYRSVEPGQFIPPDLYKAVAEVFAWLYRRQTARV
jgi:flagellar biosynthetic protein FlhB